MKIRETGGWTLPATDRKIQVLASEEKYLYTLYINICSYLHDVYIMKYDYLKEVKPYHGVNFQTQKSPKVFSFNAKQPTLIRKMRYPWVVP